MKNTEILLELIATTIKDLTAAIETLDSEKKDAKEKALKAEEAYFEELNGRKANLEKQEAIYKDELSKLREQRKKAATVVTVATSNGDIERAAQFDKELDTIDDNIKRLERKIKLSQGTELAKNEELYRVAIEAGNTFQEAKLDYMIDLKASGEACKAFETLNKLIDDKLSSNRFDRTNGDSVVKDYAEQFANEETPKKDDQQNRTVTVFAPPDFNKIREEEKRKETALATAEKEASIKATKTVTVLTENSIREHNRKHSIL